MIDMLRAADGATIEEILNATGWLSHTVRGTVAGVLKKQLGLNVTSEKVEGRGRACRIIDRLRSQRLSAGPRASAGAVRFVRPA